MRSGPLVLLLAVLALPLAARAAEPCKRAKALRSQVEQLLAQGRLVRSVRVLRKVGELCPSMSADLRAKLVTMLCEVGRWSEARSRAESIRDRRHRTTARPGARSTPTGMRGPFPRRSRRRPLLSGLTANQRAATSTAEDASGVGWLPERASN